MNLVSSLRRATKPSNPQGPCLQPGMISMVARGRLEVTLGGHTISAESAITASLSFGDHVWVEMSLGTPRIVGLIGR